MVRWCRTFTLATVTTGLLALGSQGIARTKDNSQTRHQLVETVNRFLADLDNKKFSQLKSYFTKSATSTAIFGGKPQVTKGPDGIVDPWAKNLKDITAIHHQASNFIVTALPKGQYEVRFYGIASWYRQGVKPPVTWFVGDYSWTFRRGPQKTWLITGMSYRNKFVDPPLN